MGNSFEVRLVSVVMIRVNVVVVLLRWSWLRCGIVFGLRVRKS